MIEEISIRDLGVIAEATLPLGPGFTAITGETGAGKTMVVTALGLLLGERSDSGTVRMGATQSWVEGRWLVPADGEITERVRDSGGDVDPIGESGDAELVLSRSVSPEGRSRAYAGGRSAPVAVLSELGERLVVVHGQSEQLRLKSATAQREALDRFAGAGFQASLAEYQSVWRRWKDGAAELEQLTGDRDRRVREAEELRAALDEIETAAPQPGEDAELDERIERLENAETLRVAAAEAREVLSAEESDGPDALSLLDASRRSLESAARHDAELGAIAEALQTAQYQVTDAAAQLSSYLAALDTDGSHDLELLQERKALLAALVRKHGSSLDDVIDRLQSGSARLFELDGDSDRIAELTARVAEDAAAAEELADGLSTARAAAGEELAASVTRELAALAMPDARIVVEVSDRGELGASGRDQVAILLQPHPGSEPRPLGRGASGGELSRVMLAIEVVLAGSDPVPTFVFDEVDAGVGGAAAIEIGRRLARLAERSQVLVVTHLAQVAAFANNHLNVVKDTGGAVTASSVRQLEGGEREAEMARLLSGLADSESGVAHARELLELARS
ncbi:DNA repair protein RecN [Gryllotalpicola protaetiae]|uniref:DNA repair protein RecN n=1 Tax=Gryllotalpicola protaetiae TaxID=2419771 RepID=A0A387BU58_9MICO|nr:DNA repair protein RecN [Gryllotalpicola protaetiae]AYG04576.1 DNA repair protein RecN [Gryllotalpicola protaetiae]